MWDGYGWMCLRNIYVLDPGQNRRPTGSWASGRTRPQSYFLQPDLDIDYLITSVAMRLGGYLFPRTIHSVAPSTRLDDLLHPDLRVSGGNGLCKAEVKS